MLRHDAVISTIDVMAIAEKLGIEGKVLGKDLIARCPLGNHEDKNPSFSLCISGDNRGLHQCFSCGERGNIVHLIQRVIGGDRDCAEEWLRNNFGFDQKIYSPSTEELAKGLEETPEGVEEDMGRIPLPEISDSLVNVIPYMVRRRGYTEQEAEALAIRFGIRVCEKGYYRDRIIIPIKDSKGMQVTFEAGDMTGKAEKKKLYPKGSPISRLLFNNDNVDSPHVWLVEGIWDALKLYSFGEPAVAAFGAHLSGYQARMLISKYRDVLILFDGDAAGRRAKDEVFKQLRPYVNVMAYDLRFGDPGELKKHEFRELVRWLKIG